MEEGLKILRRAFESQKNGNGDLQVGLSVGTDKSLNIGSKLVIKDGPKHGTIANISSLPVDELVTFAVKHVDQSLLNHRLWGPTLVSSIYVIFAAGMYSVRSTEVRIDHEEGKSVFSGDCTGVTPGATAAIIIAMKMHLYSTNHHIGQGAIEGYPRKIIRTLLGEEYLTGAESARVFHMIGHWADTKKILHAIGYKNIKGIVPGAQYFITRFAPSSDVALRVNNFPAGTAKIGYCVEALKLLVAHPLGEFLYSQEMAETIIRARDTIMEDPVAYHMHSKYYAQNPKNYLDVKIPDHIVCKLKTFVECVHERSSLAGAKLSGLRMTKDARVETLCRDWVSATMRSKNSRLQEYIDKTATPEIQAKDSRYSRVLHALATGDRLDGGPKKPDQPDEPPAPAPKRGGKRKKP